MKSGSNVEEVWAKLVSNCLVGFGFGSRLRLSSRLLLLLRRLRLIRLPHAEPVREEICHSDLQNKSCQSANPTREDRSTYIEHDKRNKDPNVSPPIRVLDIERKLQELVRVPERAEPASRGGVWVSEVTSSVRHVWAHVL